MAIKEVTRTLHFEAFENKKGRAKDTSAPPTITVSKGGGMRFSGRALEALSLNNKWIRLYCVPSKKIIGFQIKEKVLHEQMKTWKLVKKHPKAGTWVVSVKKMVESFELGASQKNYYSLPIKKYVERQGVMAAGETYYFVDLRDAADAPVRGKSRVALSDNDDE
jgi:hypothetical protein